MGSSTKDAAKIQLNNQDDNSNLRNLDEVEDLEWTPDQQIALLYSLIGYKPVGLHKYARMLVIQDRFSRALNKNVSCRAIWKMLHALYDLEALDEAEAECDAMVAVETEFSLPEILGEMMKAKVSGRPIRVEKIDGDYSYVQEGEMKYEIKSESELSVQENKIVDNKKEILDTPKGDIIKDIKKKGAKKNELTPTKDSALIKKNIAKETTPQKDVQGKKGIQENIKDAVKQEKKESFNKFKRDSAGKNVIEQTKKDAELKKIDSKKVVDVQKGQSAGPCKAQSETFNQLRNETPKRTEAKTLRSEIPKPQSIPKPQQVETLKKESGTDKKKEVVDKKAESKSPEKLPESRGAKLRTRGKEAESEKPDSRGTKRERLRDSISKTDAQSEEPAAKKSKIAAFKGRPTRNNIEPQQKPSSPTVYPTKRRTRLL